MISSTSATGGTLEGKKKKELAPQPNIASPPDTHSELPALTMKLLRDEQHMQPTGQEEPLKLMVTLWAQNDNKAGHQLSPSLEDGAVLLGFYKKTPCNSRLHSFVVLLIPAKCFLPSSKRFSTAVWHCALRTRATCD